MTCFYPLTAYRVGSGEIVFHDKGDAEPLELPCGQCMGCRLERSRQWAMRCIHEASMHDDNCFITLTYNAENLPPDGSLIKSDYQKFMKKLRRKYVRYAKDKNGKSYPINPIRFYHCGEYGDEFNRPHYHAILFGFNFDDWVYLFDSPAGNPIYMSPTLEKLWGKGFVTIGTVTFESAGYVARYCMKKINGPLKDQINEKTGLKHYERYNDFTGEISEVLPEYATMSNRPGIGHSWISSYRSDVYPKDFTTIRGMRMKPPKYYDRYLEQIDVEMYDEIKNGRQLDAYLSDENSSARLSAKETVKKAQFSQLKRSL